MKLKLFLPFSFTNFLLAPNHVKKKKKPFPRGGRGGGVQTHNASIPNPIYAVSIIDRYQPKQFGLFPLFKIWGNKGGMLYD